MPLERIFLETNAHFIFPFCKDMLRPKRLRRTPNSSLILATVIGTIAQLKEISVQAMEQATAGNAIQYSDCRFLCGD